MTELKAIKNPSPLVSAVLTVDEHFADLKRLSTRIDELDLKSNFDYEQSQRLITRYAETGQKLTKDIVAFVEALTNARAQAEMDAQRVSAKADQLKARKENTQDHMARFEILSDKVRALNESLLEFKRPPGETLSDQDRETLKGRLAEVTAQLGGLIEEAHELKEIGRELKLKVLESNADSMRQSLMAVSLKIKGLMEG